MYIICEANPNNRGNKFHGIGIWMKTNRDSNRVTIVAQPIVLSTDTCEKGK